MFFSCGGLASLLTNHHQLSFNYIYIYIKSYTLPKFPRGKKNILRIFLCFYYFNKCHNLIRLQQKQVLPRNFENDKKIVP